MQNVAGWGSWDPRELHFLRLWKGLPQTGHIFTCGFSLIAAILT